VGHEAITAWTSHTDIHDYQRRGPDPDTALWKSRNREAARRGGGETRRGGGGVKWINELEKALK